MAKKIVLDYSEYQDIQKEITFLKEELYKEKEKNKAVKSLKVVKTVINKTVHEVKLLKDSESFLDVWRRISSGLLHINLLKDKIDVESLAKMFFTTEIREEPTVEEISFHNVEDVKREYFQHIAEKMYKLEEKLAKANRENSSIALKVGDCKSETFKNLKEISYLKEENKSLSDTVKKLMREIQEYRVKQMSISRIAGEIYPWNRKEKLKQIQAIRNSS